MDEDYEAPTRVLQELITLRLANYKGPPEVMAAVIVNDVMTFDLVSFDARKWWAE